LQRPKWIYLTETDSSVIITSESADISLYSTVVFTNNLSEKFTHLRTINKKNTYTPIR